MDDLDPALLDLTREPGTGHRHRAGILVHRKDAMSSEFGFRLERPEQRVRMAAAAQGAVDDPGGLLPGHGEQWLDERLGDRVDKDGHMDSHVVAPDARSR